CADAGRLCAHEPKRANKNASRRTSNSANKSVSPCIDAMGFGRDAVGFCRDELTRHRSRRPDPLRTRRSFPASLVKPAGSRTASRLMIRVRRHAIVFITSGINAMDTQHRWPAIFAGIVVGFVLGSAGVKAEDKYPSKPVRIVVSFSAGGPTDTVARVMGAKMADLLGHQFVLENKVGAGGTVAA